MDKIGSETQARREELCTLLSREEGKARQEGIAELLALASNSSPAIARACAATKSRRCAQTWAWSQDAWRITPALDYVKCVVMKPAKLVPSSTRPLAETISRAGLPPGVVNLLMGHGAVALNDRRVDAISYTGSVAAGKEVAMANMQIEMGVKIPLEALDDADLATPVLCAVGLSLLGRPAPRRVHPADRRRQDL